MSRTSLKADALRMHVRLEHKSYGRWYQTPPSELRRGILGRIYGPGFPGFVARTAEEVDRHITLVADCSEGKHGKALSLAFQGYWGRANATEEIAALASRKRKRPMEESAAAAKLDLWDSIFRAARICYTTACSVRGVLGLDVLPDVSEMPIKLPLPPKQPVEESIERQLAALHGAIGKVRRGVASLPQAAPLPIVGALGRTLTPASDPSINCLVRLEAFEQALIAAHERISGSVPETRRLGDEPA